MRCTKHALILTAIIITTGCVERDLLNTSAEDLNCTRIDVREASKKYIAMLKTGQTSTYFAGDDGYNQNLIGAARSYTRQSNTVIDNVTGLMWQDDENPATVVKKWSESINYCTELNLSGYDDWRLPDTMELGTIVNFGKYDLGNEVEFENFYDNYHWSSTTYEGECNRAWLQSFDRRYIHNFGKSSALSIRCVRGGDENLTGGFFRDDFKGIVEHNTTGLMWQDDDNVTKTWEDAITYCEGLVLGEYDNWRLPNRNEIASIIEYTNFNPAIDAEFQNIVANNYWTSTTRAEKNENNRTNEYAYSGNFYNGELDSILKTRNEYVRCVR